MCSEEDRVVLEKGVYLGKENIMPNEHKRGNKHNVSPTAERDRYIVAVAPSGGTNPHFTCYLVTFYTTRIKALKLVSASDGQTNPGLGRLLTSCN